MTKTCTKCGDTKPLDEYHKNKSRKDGHHAYCKECVREYNRAHLEANREKIEKRRRAYRRENRDFLSRDISQRIKQASDLTRLTATRDRKQWEQWEDDFITNHPEMTAYQLATHLGRTYGAVAHRRPLLEKSAASD